MIQSKGHSNPTSTFIMGDYDLKRSLQIENTQQYLCYPQYSQASQDSNHLNSSQINNDNKTSYKQMQIDSKQYQNGIQQLQLDKQDLLMKKSQIKQNIHQKSNSIDSFKFNYLNCTQSQKSQKNCLNNLSHNQIKHSLPPTAPIIQVQQQVIPKYSDNIILSNNTNNSLTSSQLRQSNFIQITSPKKQNSCNKGNNGNTIQKQNRSISDYDFQQNNSLKQVYPQMVVSNSFQNNNLQKYVIKSPQNLSPPISNRMENQKYDQQIQQYTKLEQQNQLIQFLQQKNTNINIQSGGNPILNLTPSISIQNKINQTPRKIIYKHHKSQLNSNEGRYKNIQSPIPKNSTNRNSSPLIKEQKNNQQTYVINSIKTTRSKSLATDPFMNIDRPRAGLTDIQLNGNLNVNSSRNSFNIISKLNLSTCNMQENLCQQKNQRYNLHTSNQIYSNQQGALSDRTINYQVPIQQKDQKINPEIYSNEFMIQQQNQIKQNQKILNQQQANYNIKIPQKLMVSQELKSQITNQNQIFKLNLNQQYNQFDKQTYNQPNYQLNNQTLPISTIQQLCKQQNNSQSINENGNYIKQNSQSNQKYNNVQPEIQNQNQDLFQNQKCPTSRKQTNQTILITFQQKSQNSSPTKKELIQQTITKNDSKEQNQNQSILNFENIKQNETRVDNITPNNLNGDDLISQKYKTIKQKLNNLTNMSNELLNRSQIDINQRVEKMIEDQIAIRQKEILKASRIKNDDELAKNVEKVKIFIEQKNLSSPIDSIQQYMKKQNENGSNNYQNNQIQQSNCSSTIKENEIYNRQKQQSTQYSDLSSKHLQLIQNKIDSIKSSISKESIALQSHKTDSTHEENQILQNNNINNQNSSLMLFQNQITNSHNQNSRRNSILVNGSDDSLVKQEKQIDQKTVSATQSNDSYQKTLQQLNQQQFTNNIDLSNKNLLLNPSNKTPYATSTAICQNNKSIDTKNQQILKNNLQNNENHNNKSINQQEMQQNQTKNPQNSNIENSQYPITEFCQKNQQIQNNNYSSPMLMDNCFSTYSPAQSNKIQGTTNTYQTEISQSSTINYNDKQKNKNEHQNIDIKKQEQIDNYNISQIMQPQTEMSQSNCQDEDTIQQFNKQFAEEVSSQFTQENNLKQYQENDINNYQAKFTFTKNKTFNQTNQPENINSNKNLKNESGKEQFQSSQSQLHNQNYDQQNMKLNQVLSKGYYNNQEPVLSEKQNNRYLQQAIDYENKFEYSQLQTEQQYQQQFQEQKLSKQNENNLINQDIVRNPSDKSVRINVSSSKNSNYQTDEMSLFESQKTLHYIDQQGAAQPMIMEQTAIRRQSFSDSNSEYTDISQIENQFTQENFLYQNSMQKTRQLKDKLQKIRLETGLDIEKYVEKLYKNLGQTHNQSQKLQQKQNTEQNIILTENEQSEIFNINLEDFKEIVSKNTLHFTPSSSISSEQQFQDLKNQRSQEIEQINQIYDLPPHQKDRYLSELLRMQPDIDLSQIEENESFQKIQMEKNFKKSSFYQNSLNGSNQEYNQDNQQSFKQSSNLKFLQTSDKKNKSNFSKKEMKLDQLEKLQNQYHIDQFGIYSDELNEQKESCITQSFQTVLTDNQQIDNKNNFQLNQMDQNNQAYQNKFILPSQNISIYNGSKNTTTGLNTNSQSENNEIGTEQIPFSISPTIQKSSNNFNHPTQTSQEIPSVIKSNRSSKYDLSSDFSSSSQSKIDNFQNIKNIPTQNNNQQIKFETPYNFQQQERNNQFLTEYDQKQIIEQQNNNQKLLNSQNINIQQESQNQSHQEDLENLNIQDLQQFITNYIQNINIQKKNYKKQYKSIKSQFKYEKQLIKQSQSLNLNIQQVFQKLEYYIKDIKIKINYIDLQKTELDKKNFNCTNPKEIIFNYLKHSQLISKGINKITITFLKINDIQQNIHEQPFDQTECFKINDSNLKYQQ